MPQPLATSPHHTTVRSRARAAACASAIVLALAIAASTATADPLKDQLHRTRAQKQHVTVQISAKERRVRSLQHQLDTLNGRIRALDVPIGDLTADINDLQARVDHRTTRIAELRQEYVSQRTEIAQLGNEVEVARARLAARMVAVYRGEGAADDIGSWVTGVQSISQLLQRREALGTLTQSDGDIVASIADIQRRVRIARAGNHDLRDSLAAEVQGIQADQGELEASRQKLYAQRAQVLALRATRARLQHQVEGDIGDLRDEVDQLDEDSKVLRDVINNGGSFGGAVPGLSANGLIWPVNGPIVSGFGMRWGRMHEGVDIAVPTGVPIHAAQSGVVIYAGWQSGYGNIVIIKHSGVLATAYGHQSRLNSTVGQVVVQGQVIGFVGCTGHCFGPHVHFETRVNGTAVDPMKYL